MLWSIQHVHLLTRTAVLAAICSHGQYADPTLWWKSAVPSDKVTLKVFHIERPYTAWITCHHPIIMIGRLLNNCLCWAQLPPVCAISWFYVHLLYSPLAADDELPINRDELIPFHGLMNITLHWMSVGRGYKCLFKAVSSDKPYEKPLFPKQSAMLLWFARRLTGDVKRCHIKRPLWMFPCNTISISHSHLSNYVRIRSIDVNTTRNARKGQTRGTDRDAGYHGISLGSTGDSNLITWIQPC